MQLVLVVPALLLMVLLVVQAALAWHARHVAEYAARQGLGAARVENGTAAVGEAAVRQSLAAVGGRVLTNSSVSVDRTTLRTTVHVNGHAARILPVPGLELRISGTASGPTEKVTTPGGGAQ